LSGFDPVSLQVINIEANEDNLLASSTGAYYRYCKNYSDYSNCNWLVYDYETDYYCVSCRLNRTIPNLSKPQNLAYWTEIERAKRRLIYTLLSLNLPVMKKTKTWPYGMAFDFKEDDPIQPETLDQQVLTGHHNGIITINIAEADDVKRAMARKRVNEDYRTLLGHFRHESGHYFFYNLINTYSLLNEFQQVFGDTTVDYESALNNYYAYGPIQGWNANYISAYASSHPLEDWAETWAHTLHIIDSLETAYHYRITDSAATFQNFSAWIKLWDEVSVTLNEMNRSMGTRDAYPFVIGSGAKEKLAFIYQLLAGLLRAS
jgi:hypothetical protein